MTKGFKLTIIGLSIALLIVLATAIIIFVTRETVFAAPSQPTLIIVGDERFLDVTSVNGATTYIFRIDGVEFETNESTLRVTNVLLQARTYIVEVAVKGKQDKNMSPFSTQINIANKVVLPSPILSYDSDLRLLQWTTCGDDATYEIYMNGTIVATVSALTYDCTSLVGEFNIYVKAIPSDPTFYLASVKSNTRTIIGEQQLDAPTGLEFDAETGIFSFTAPSNSTGLEIMYEIIYNGETLINVEPNIVNDKLTVDISIFFEITQNPSIRIKALGTDYYLDSEYQEL